MLVLGAAGGVGIAAVELGKAMGLHVTAAASSEAKVDFAIDVGAASGLCTRLMKQRCRMFGH